MTGIIDRVKELHSRNAGIYQFFKFAVTGTIGAAFDFGIFAILHSYFGWHYLRANFVSVFIAICVTFLFNKFWTFRAKGTEDLRRQTFKFFVVATANYFLQQLLLFLFVSYLPLEAIFGKVTQADIEDFSNIKALICKALAIFIVMFSNFFLNKFWTFKGVANTDEKVS